MITQWDIISSINRKTGAITYSLLIDGTEHDARLIAKKLQGYVQAAEPAVAPFVYSFALPDDLDEDTLEKIRVATREGIEQAKKVNEFIPGGSLGNPLFHENIEKEDKDFPTFITLDPSESFFQASDEKREGALSEINLEEEPEENKILTSLESEEPWPDTPAADKEDSLAGLDLQVQAVEAEELPSEIKKQAVPAMEKKEKREEREELPLSEKDMFNKDMEGTLLDPALEDIFSAETKYDMFLDLNALTPAEEQAKAATETQQESQVKSVKDIPQVSEQDVATHEPVQEDEDGFNIFDQQIKDQTCFMDLDDVKIVTERITQKDLGFIQHAQVEVNTEEKKAAEEEQSVKKPEIPKAPIPPQKTTTKTPKMFSRFNQTEDTQEEVLDPFEQMLASAKAKEQEKAEETPANSVPAAEENMPQQPAATNNETLSSVPAQEEDTPAREPISQPEPPSGVTERENRVVPPPAAPIMEKKMSENTGDKKPILRIKRKEQAPAAPAVPPPAPKPMAPAAPIAATPAAPVAPASAMPPTPQAPIAPVAPMAPVEPQEEKQHTILRRRRPATNTVLEKTRTIDHSIEMPVSELKKHNWPLEVPLIPTYTLENMTISINRFAHATAISVIENPGRLYNPLVLHGAGGTGKTHFLHAIGYALSKKYGQENIFITNGVRLSRGIQRYLMEGNIDKFEEFISSVKALLIDDIHLLAVNEQNRVHLSKLLNSFREQHKQIVVTSKYPPESLAKLEELLNFKLDSGWISELKGASDPARTRIVQKMLLSNNISITDEAVHRFFGKPNMSLGTVNRAIRRVKVLEKLIFPQLALEERSSEMLFDKLLATGGEDQKSLVWKKSIDEISSAPVVGNGEWGRIGFFYPQNSSNMMNWLVFALQQRAKELGISGGPELVVRSSYSTDNIISSAFKIANLCDNKKLKGAVILGPELGICDPSVRENFYDILTHMLEIMLIRCGVINYESANDPSTYVKILSELLR